MGVYLLVGQDGKPLSHAPVGGSATLAVRYYNRLQELASELQLEEAGPWRTAKLKEQADLWDRYNRIIQKP